MKTNILLPSLLLACLPLTGSPARGNTSGQQTLAPYFVVLGDENTEEGASEALPLKKTEARVRIAGVIADVELRQIYRNTTKAGSAPASPSIGVRNVEGIGTSSSDTGSLERKSKPGCCCTRTK